MNRAELERYVRLYRRAVCGAALCCVRNMADAEDITQDVFLKLYTCDTEFESDEHVKAWLIRCAVNRGRSLLRSHWHKNSVPLEKADGMQHSDTYDGGMLEIMRKLPQNNRVALYMHYYEGYAPDDIAKILGISPNTVYSRLRRGRSQLRRLLTNERDDLDDGLQGFF